MRHAPSPSDPDPARAPDPRGDAALLALAAGLFSLVSAVFPVWDLASLPVAALAGAGCGAAIARGGRPRWFVLAGSAAAVLAVPLAIVSIVSYAGVGLPLLPALGSLLDHTLRADL